MAVEEAAGWEEAEGGRPLLSAIVLGLAALVFTGCGLFYYSKPGSGYPEFREASVACARDFGIPSGNGQYAVVSPDLYRRCMRDKGWVREQRVDPGSGWFRGIEDNEPVELATGPRQGEPGGGSGSESRRLICRRTYLEVADWRNNLTKYQECLSQ
jgi:hypothetical protein